MPEAFDPGFEFHMYQAMLTTLPGFQSHGLEPQTVEEAQYYIYINIPILEHATREVREEVITWSLFPGWYYNPQERARITWIRREKNEEYTNIVTISIMIAKRLVREPQARNNPRVWSSITGLREIIRWLKSEHWRAVS